MLEAVLALLTRLKSWKNIFRHKSLFFLQSWIMKRMMTRRSDCRDCCRSDWALERGAAAGILYCTLHTAHYTLYTTLHTTQCTQHTTHYIAHYTLHAAHWTLHSAPCVLHTEYYNLHTAPRTLHIWHYTLHSIYQLLYTVHFMLHAAHWLSCTQCTVVSLPLQELCMQQAKLIETQYASS